MYLYQPMEVYGEKGELLGKGMDGKVYALGDNFSVKFANPDSISRLLTEISITLKLRQCKFVASCIDAGTTDEGIPYLITRRAIGNLGQNFNRVDLNRTVYQIIAGILYLLKTGYKHDDLDLNNILVIDPEMVVISDMARILETKCTDIYEHHITLDVILLLIRLSNHYLLSRRDKEFFERIEEYTSIYDLAMDNYLIAYRRKDIISADQIGRYTRDKCKKRIYRHMKQPKNFHISSHQRAFDMGWIQNIELPLDDKFRVMCLYDFIYRRIPTSKIIPREHWIIPMVAYEEPIEASDLMIILMRITIGKFTITSTTQELFDRMNRFLGLDYIITTPFHFINTDVYGPKLQALVIKVASLYLVMPEKYDVLIRYAKLLSPKVIIGHIEHIDTHRFFISKLETIE